jgi:hypothetical protein
LEYIVLAIKEIEGNYKGKNLIPVIIEVIRNWDIAYKLGYIVINNTGNNNTIIIYISKGIYFI